MIGAGIIVDKVIKILAKQFKFDKILDYVENPNDADERIDKLELDVYHQSKLIEKLEKDSYPPVCKKCNKKIKE
tara:strand:- start:416 stop:637 length:222 start_codon:yes stop_codon:yes gene_type:complete